MSHPKTGWCQRPLGLRILVLVVPLLVPACADTIFYAPLSPPPRPLSPRPAEKVEVFAITPPTRPHTNLRLLQIVQGAANDHGIPEMIASLRQRAAEIGCDAILGTSIDNQAGRDHHPSIQAGCIVYKEAAASEGDHSSAPVAPNREAAQPTSRLALVEAAPGEVRTAPHLIAPIVMRLESGQRVSVSSDATDGWRVVKLPDGRAGYIQDTAIRFE